jgi:eukaryotic-like serine/threonine-protein kinase
VFPNRAGGAAGPWRLRRSGMSSSSGIPEKQLGAEDFLRHVLRSELLGRDELQASLRGVPRDQRDDAQTLADHLVRNGKLTRFQAGRLMKGISQGLVLGPFVVLAPIGRGGMGKVFLVRDTRSRQMVALKILPPRLARTEVRMLARFRREMELSQKVAHQHIAWTYEVGEFRGVPYIAMEYIPGRTLSRIVNDDGPLSPPRAARLMAEVASGISHAHEQGLIHRDLKPGNILITPRDQAKVLDLGLALVEGEVVVDAMVVGGQGYIVGTMDYIAPEQTLDAASVGPRCDLYSLGCTLYFALAGQPPFPGGTSKEKIAKHRREKPTPLASLAPDSPPGLVAFIERLMDKNPQRRPSSAQEVERELRLWGAGDDEPPPDEAEEVSYDETVMMQQGPGSTDLSAVSLPEIEIFDLPQQPAVEERGNRWPPHTVTLLVAAAITLSLVVLVVALILILAPR